MAENRIKTFELLREQRGLPKHKLTGELFQFEQNVNTLNGTNSSYLDLDIAKLPEDADKEMLLRDLELVLTKYRTALSRIEAMTGALDASRGWFSGISAARTEAYSTSPSLEVADQFLKLNAEFLSLVGGMREKIASLQEKANKIRENLPLTKERFIRELVESLNEALPEQRNLIIANQFAQLIDRIIDLESQQSSGGEAKLNVSRRVVNNYQLRPAVTPLASEQPSTAAADDRASERPAVAAVIEETGEKSGGEEQGLAFNLLSKTFGPERAGRFMGRRANEQSSEGSPNEPNKKIRKTMDKMFDTVTLSGLKSYEQFSQALLTAENTPINEITAKVSKERKFVVLAIAIALQKAGLVGSLRTEFQQAYDAIPNNERTFGLDSAIAVISDILKDVNRAGRADIKNEEHTEMVNYLKSQQERFNKIFGPVVDQDAAPQAPAASTRANRPTEIRRVGDSPPSSQTLPVDQAPHKIATEAEDPKKEIKAKAKSVFNQQYAEIRVMTEPDRAKAFGQIEDGGPRARRAKRYYTEVLNNAITAETEKYIAGPLVTLDVRSLILVASNEAIYNGLDEDDKRGVSYQDMFNFAKSILELKT